MVMTMTQRSLRQALARQWMAFAAALSILLAAATLLLLFLLEDSFIDRRLHAMAATVVDPATAPASLPASARVIQWPELPQDIHARMAGKRPGAIAEFRRADGRYVHVLSTRTEEGRPFVLVYDVTDELTVNPGLRNGLAYALALLLLSLLSAYLLARVFVTRNLRHARTLMQQVLASPDPRSLEALARKEPIKEFSELLQLHAGVWRAQQDAVERERETLAFLAHELRTPLQSANTSLALLAESPADSRALDRLRRATGRLTRASNAILWLASDADVPGGHTHAATSLEVLANDFRPLAAVRDQSIKLLVAPGLYWAAPWEVVETILANLLLNAIQHGSAGTILLEANDHRLILRNPMQDASSAGFGLGLRIVQRLANRIGWQVDFTQQPEGARCEVRWPRATTL